jgi:hypothetical protein
VTPPHLYKFIRKIRGEGEKERRKKREGRAGRDYLNCRTSNKL